MERYQKVFKALGEMTRLKIIKLLAVKSFCVCELAALLDMRQPRISQHLRVLKEAGLVTERKEAYWNYYSLNREYLKQVFEDFNVFLKEALEDHPDFKPVAARIKHLHEDNRVARTKAKLKSR
ncbi:ArsR/SmtB family transcription factor [Calderihabitans maritimus]|nr:metalloregulator ArsR/SmtB family transcription factor [Calderihabitans maritimus]